MDNQAIAERLIDYAHHLEARQASLYRVKAYRRAAETVLTLDRPVAEMVAEQGRDALEALPGIGSHLSFTIEGLVRTGEFHTVSGDDARMDIERVFASLPGIGPRLARRIHDELRMETLEELEQAAHDGRLARLDVGPKRLRGIQDALAVRLRQPPRPVTVLNEPGVAELLAVDREYRALAEQGALPTLAPRRFNPSHEAWLPLLETERGGWHYRALFSNTALAHQLGQTRDWVVLFFERGPTAAQRTVVTETRGALRGSRVVRGRERECRELAEGEKGPSAA